MSLSVRLGRFGRWPWRGCVDMTRDQALIEAFFAAALHEHAKLGPAPIVPGGKALNVQERAATHYLQQGST
jgi:hypothetical protein